MKLRKSILLSLLSIALMGCSPSDSTVNPGTSGEIPNNTGDTGNTGDKGNTGDTGDTGNKGNTGGTGDTGTKGDTGEKEEPDDGTNHTDWNDEAWAAMKKYLGGNVLPYVHLGKSIEVTYKSAATERSYLYLAGDLSINKSKIDEFTKAYSDAKWTITASGETTFEASNSSLGLSVSVKADAYEYVSVSAYYDEPYDETKLTAWSDDIKSTFSSALDKHSDIPFVYLGTATPVATAGTKKVTILGGTWDEKIYTYAEKVFDADTNWKVSKTASTKITATATMYDNCTVTVVITYGGKDYKKASCTISYTEGYYAGDYTDWPSSFDTYKTNNFDGHEIPAIYLGTKNPSYSTAKLSTDNTLTVNGGTYNAQCVTDAKALMEQKKADGWEYEATTINSYPGIIAYNEFSDDCRIIFTVGANGNSASNAKNTMVIHYESKDYDGTTTQTDWPTAVTEKFTQYFDSSIEIPYVYLNTDAATASWTSASHTLTIEGQTGYNSTIAQKAETAFKAENWTTDLEWTINGLDFSATKTFANKDKVTATLSAVSTKGNKVRMTLKYEEAYHEPASGSWPSAIEKSMQDYYNGYVLPYVYLGARTPSYETTKSSLKHTIKGVAWDDQIFTSFKTALTKESEDTTSPVTWTFAEEDTTKYGKQITATGTNSSDGFIFTVKVYKYTGDIPYLEMTAKEAFNPNAASDWTDDEKTTFNKLFQNHLPTYTYLGTRNLTISTYTNSLTKEGYYAKITGGDWDDSVTALAKTNLEKAGYTVQLYRGYYGGKELYAYLTNEDGTSFTYYLYKSASTSGKCAAYIFYDTAPTTDTVGDWSDAVKTDMKTALGGNVFPYISTGDTVMTSKVSSSSPGDGTIKLTFSGSGFTRTYLYNMMKTLKKDDENWEFDFVYRNGAPSTENNIKKYGILKGSVEKADGSKYSFIFNCTSSLKAELNITYGAPTTSKPTAWDSDVQDDMKSMLNGTVLPYVYLGKEKVSSSVSTVNGYMKVSGGIWSDSMLTEAKAAFEADKSHTWTCGTDYSTSGHAAFVATTEGEDGYHITVKVTYTDNTTYNVKEAYLQAWYL